MTYTIHYYSSSVQAELFALPETLQGKYVRLAERMEIFGANLGAPHTKAFGDGLFEQAPRHGCQVLSQGDQLLALYANLRIESQEKRRTLNWR